MSVKPFHIERSRYASFENTFRVRAQLLISAHLRGEMDTAATTQKMSVLLKDFHRSMFLAGRRSVGNSIPNLSQQDLRMLHGAHSADMKYFHNFMRVVREGGGKMPYNQRMDLYALGGYSVYLRGAVLGTVSRTPETIKWHWMLNKDKENCKDCLDRYELSMKKGGLVYAELSKIGFPGERTACGHRCWCGLVSEFGALRRTRPTSFKHAQYLTKKMTVRLGDYEVELDDLLLL